MFFFQPKDVKMDFPDLEQIAKESDQIKDQKASHDDMNQQKKKFKQDFGVSGGRKQGIPTFFGI